MASLEQRCILLAAFAEESGLEIRLRPDWKDVISAPDRGYVATLFRDFADRAISDPAALFEQICSLSVGRLVAVEVGDDLAARGDVASLWEGYVGLLGAFE